MKVITAGSAGCPTSRCAVLHQSCMSDWWLLAFNYMHLITWPSLLLPATASFHSRQSFCLILTGPINIDFIVV